MVVGGVEEVEGAPWILKDTAWKVPWKQKADGVWFLPGGWMHTEGDVSRDQIVHRGFTTEQGQCLPDTVVWVMNKKE